MIGLGFAYKGVWRGKLRPITSLLLQHKATQMLQNDAREERG